MALKLLNDRNEFVFSIGASNSLENLKCRRPVLLDSLESWKNVGVHENGFSWHMVESFLKEKCADVERWEYKLIAKFLGVGCD